MSYGVIRERLPTTDFVHYFFNNNFLNSQPLFKLGLNRFSLILQKTFKTVGVTLLPYVMAMKDASNETSIEI